MKRGSLDTNVLLRLILNDLPTQHRQARELLNCGGQFVISDLAVGEVVFVLERNYKMARDDIAVVIKSLLAGEQFIANTKVINLALTNFVEHTALSFEDCYLAAQAEIEKALPLYTFDKKLAKRLSTTELVG